MDARFAKCDGDLGMPNLYVPVSRELAKEEVRLLHQAFGSQSSKHWFEDELFLGLMRIRGMEGRARSGYAEPVVCRKSALVIE